MDYSAAKSRILAFCTLLLMTRIRGQLDSDYFKICDFCGTEGIVDCNVTDMNKFNMTKNCDLANNICTLAISQSIESNDNLTMDSISQDQICFLRDDLEATPTPTIIESAIVTLTETTIGLEPTTEEYTTTQGSMDYQDDRPNEIVRSSRSDPVTDLAENQPPPPPPLNKKYTCFVCKSSSNGHCLNNLDSLKPVECTNALGCMSFYFDGNLMRDCATPNDAELCQKTENVTCDWCQDDMCNKKPWKQCYHCNSNDDSNCALWSNTHNVPITICANSNDKCLTSITTDGATVRNCSTADFKCQNADLCSTCDGSLCNAGVFPENRRRCIQCEECEEAQEPATALPCRRYNPEDQCFLYVTAKSKMIRGCVSNADDMQKCRMNEPMCMSCGDSNGCNFVPLMKDPTLSCIKCRSKDDPSCAWAQPTTASAETKCKNKVLYYLQETCMAKLDHATKEAVRDCSFDYGVCTSEDKNCTSCSDNGCNRDSLKVQQCIQCNSGNPEQAKCGCQAEGIPPTKCPQEKQIYEETKGCFTMTKGNLTTRGCIASLSKDELKLCKEQGKSFQCDLCVEDGCNNLLARSHGRRNLAVTFLTVIGTVFLIL